MLPGFKVIIKGPVVCRRGVIMLEESNFELLAGEVDSLLIKNASENVFARALNLPENPDPYNDNENAADTIQDKVDELFAEDFEIDDDELTLIESSHNIKKNNNTKITKPELSNDNNQTIQKMMTSVGARKSEAFNELPVLFDPVAVEDEAIDFPDDDDEFMAMAASTNEYTSVNNHSNSTSEKLDRLSQSTSNLAVSAAKNNSTNNSTTSKSVETNSIKENKNNQNADLEIFDDMDFDFDDELLTQQALEESLKKFSNNTNKNNSSMNSSTEIKNKYINLNNAPSTSTTTSAIKSTVNYLNNKNYTVL